MGAAVGVAAAARLAASTTPRLFSWVAYPVVATALVCGSVYSWLRLPFWLGWLASELITRLANDITLTSRVLIDASAGMRSLLAAVADDCLRVLVFSRCV